MKKRIRIHIILACLVVLSALQAVAPGAAATAGEKPVLDSLGNRLEMDKVPGRIVSLVPTATEILFEIGAGSAVAGLTYHDALIEGAADKTVVGGFFQPSVEQIRELAPDLVILSSLHREVAAAFQGQALLFYYETRSVAQSHENILALGRMMKKDGAAGRIVRQNRAELELIRRKVEKVAPDNRKRVIRLMGRDQVMTPGNDSFQNDLIRLAGGIPPDFGKSGPVVDVTKEEWQAFNPEVIYGCDDDQKTADKFFSLPGWKDVTAVKTGKTAYFPCELTCRAATRTGYFVSWLAATIYTREFADPDNWLLPAGRTASEPVRVGQAYVESAAVHTTTILDFNNKTLFVEFKRPQTVVSSLQGERSGILAVGNHYSPPPTWGPGHYTGIETIRANVLAANGMAKETTTFLVTGADMGNLSVREAGYKDMRVTVLATAGVLTNAVRMSRDEGKFYEPGTINVIVMANVKLSRRAMTKAIITATEAKTAVIEDLDVRSTYTPLPHAATGTGTDNVLVVQGEGVTVENAGGHSKLGELIGQAVYAAVTDAIQKQDKLTGRRHIFQRLKERKLSLYSLTSGVACDCMHQNNIEKRDFSRRVEHLMLMPEYAGFLESALALSDAWERGQIKDLTAFEAWCVSVASGIAGRPVAQIEDLVTEEGLPRVLETALNAVFTGVMEELRHE